MLALAASEVDDYRLLSSKTADPQAGRYSGSQASTGGVRAPVSVWHMPTTGEPPRSPRRQLPS
jgi:hypothetical protein